MRYEFTGETLEYEGRTLRRVRYVETGKVVGWIESEANLSQEGKARVLDHAKVYGAAKVFYGEWEKTPLQIQGSRYFFCVSSPDSLTVGCKTKTVIELLEDAKSGLETTPESVGFFSRETIQDMLFAVVGILDEVIAELQAPLRWETPEQWEKRTGEKYPDKAPVWCADNDDHVYPWFLDYYENAVEDERYYILCAVGGLVPPNNWRPDEEKT